MVCQSCGAPLDAGVRFCSRCGAAVAPEPHGQAAAATGPGSTPYAVPQYAYGGGVAVPRPPRVAMHVRQLGIVWVCFGVWRVLSGFLGMFFLSAMTTHRGGAWGLPYGHWGYGLPPHWMGFMVPVIATMTVVSAGLAFATGYALLNRKSWGRVVALIAGILALFKFPLGTALGIYTLWVLLPSPSAVEYDRLSATTGS